MGKFSSAWRFMKDASEKKDTARVRRQSRRSERALKHYNTSGIHDRGGGDTVTALEEADYFTRRPDSLPVLSCGGSMIWLGVDRPVHIIAPPGTGKTTKLGFPIAASWPHSLIILDVDHEYFRALNRHHRRSGKRVISMNARRKYGIPSARWNFFEPVIVAILTGDIETALERSRDIAAMLVPKAPNIRHQNEWIDAGANEIIVMALLAVAHRNPEQCTPVGIYSLLSLSIEEIASRIAGMTDLPVVMRRLRNFEAEYIAGGDKQVLWKIEKALEILKLFEPEAAYAKASFTSDFDPSSFKNGEAPTALYFCVDGDELESGGPYIALVLSMLIERVAAAQGNRPVLFLCDEFARLPKMEALIKGVAAYRKRLLRFVTFATSRSNIAHRYGTVLQKDLEDMAGVKVWLRPSLDVARELEAKSGTKTVAAHGGNDSASANFGRSITEHSVPNLHTAELTGLQYDKAVLEVGGLHGPIIVDAYPWWDISPFCDQIDQAYRDDSYRYQDVDGR